MLGQSAYALKLLEWSSMAECKPCMTPMEERLKLTKASTAVKVDATLYRSIIGGLRYLVHTRPDVAFAMGYVSRFMEDPREDRWATVKRLLRYVKGMVDQLIIFPKTGRSGLQFTVFSDADMAGDIDGRRRTSDVLVFLRSAPISWLSLKQKKIGKRKKGKVGKPYICQRNTHPSSPTVKRTITKLVINPDKPNVST
ncbi:secreted RxLR effector protein 161-like [Miscanthus floridulus]|uniref:secreted RxLR effector protein 161-like n=1 Tax=Miscanthus floridulus TaxID=154761 RepID=UPI00345B3D53